MSVIRRAFPSYQFELTKKIRQLRSEESDDYKRQSKKYNKIFWYVTIDVLGTDPILSEISDISAKFDKSISIPLTMSEIIKNLRRGYLKQYYGEGDPRSLGKYCDINRGPCDSFADELNEIVPESEVVETGQMMEESKKDLIKLGFSNFNSIDLYAHHGGRNIEFASHYWIYYKGKHYDAESPEGVKWWWDLPLFRRSFRRQKISMR